MAKKSVKKSKATKATAKTEVKKISAKELKEQEIAKIISAARLTWEVIHSDTMALFESEGGSPKKSDAVELILDCGRITTFGRLDQKIAQKYDSQLERILLKNSKLWF